MKLFKIILFLFVLLGISKESFSQNSSINETYKKQLEQILEDDQKFRKAGVLQNQIPIDRLNRIKLDDLYKLYGFPSIKKVGREGLLASILILHHSEDCEWNKKWVNIFLDNYEETKNFQVLVSYMFERTYGKDMGICKDEKYINSLLEHYSSEVIQEFGIDKHR